MSEAVDENGHEQTDSTTAGIIFYIKNNPVMQTAVDVISAFGKARRVILKAKGNSIPNAVAVANILTEKMLRGNSKIQKINVDSEMTGEIGRMVSTIEITIDKT